MPEITHISANFVMVQIGKMRFWYSYTTCIAFQVGVECYRSENVWSNTTKRHLNQIGGKELKNDEFKEKLEFTLKQHNMTWDS